MSNSVYSSTLPPEPYDVTDEVVNIDRPYTSTLGSFYYGWLGHVSDQQIFRDTTGTYGVWNGAGKTGGQVLVVADLPASGEVCFDRGGQLLISTVERTVYARYQAICKSAAGEQGELVIPAFGLMNTSSSMVVHRSRFQDNQAFTGVSVSVVTAASGAVTFTLASGAQSATVSLANGETSAEADISLSVSGANELTISAGANTALVNNPVFVLRR